MEDFIYIPVYIYIYISTIISFSKSTDSYGFEFDEFPANEGGYTKAAYDRWHSRYLEKLSTRSARWTQIIGRMSLNGGSNHNKNSTGF